MPNRINEPCMVIFADNLRRLRYENELSQEDLAEKAGLALGTIKQYEGRINWPRPENVTSIAKAFGIHFSRLFIDPRIENRPSVREALEIITEAFGIEKKRLTNKHESFSTSRALHF